MVKLQKLYLSLILFFMYAPIAVLIIFSFNDSRSRGIWGGFTLRWYTELFNNRQIMEALYNTLIIAILSSLFATAIGTLAAVGINNMKKNTKKIILGLSSIPMSNPDIVTGVSLMILYISVFRLVGAGRLGFMTLLLSHIAFNIPYVIFSVLPRLKNMDNNLYEAALDLGATPLYAFFKVIVPQLMPGIFTGAIISFTLSVDDFMVSFFTTGTGVSNLSILIFSMARKGVNPTINALSTLMFVSIIILLYIINKRDSNKFKNIK